MVAVILTQFEDARAAFRIVRVERAPVARRSHTAARARFGLLVQVRALVLQHNLQTVYS